MNTTNETYVVICYAGIP